MNKSSPTKKDHTDYKRFYYLSWAVGLYVLLSSFL